MAVFTSPEGLALVRAAGSQTPLNPSGGSIAGTLDARDGALAQLRTRIDALAGALISEVNAVHSTGYALDGTTGNDFFSGTNAGTIAVNAALRDNPSLIQVSNSATESGDNSVALALARLATQPVGSLNNQTFSVAYGSLVADLGHAVKTAGDQLAGHEAVNTMLLKQRDSISGVSIDEEMTHLMAYQRAYQASARIVTTVDELLETVLTLKR
jgi:flagellar hook-associated protein 1 FlgK